MNAHTVIDTFGTIGTVNLSITLCLNIAWATVCMLECYRFVNRYINCKRTPDLHPIYKDVQYLSRQRRLYNLKTHIVKYILVITCVGVEVLGLICIYTSIFLKGNRPNSTVIASDYNNEYPHCHVHSTLWQLYSEPMLLIFLNLTNFIWLLIFVLISILTRYLAARYLNHPFTKTPCRYIAWVVIQFCIVSSCSISWTFLVSVFVFPVLFLINWLVLFRDNVILSRILKSNLREIHLHSNNTVLYREQASSYRFYHFFQKVLLTSLLLIATTICIPHLTYFVDLFNHDSFCILNIIYKFNFTHNAKVPHSANRIIDIIDSVCFLLYSFSSCLPLIFVTLIPVIRACVKRYKSRYLVYRYNYENMEYLIRK